MLKRLLTIVFAVVAIAGFAGTSQAQYMFLDMDGDGVNTPGVDVLNPNCTPTLVDVYLYTDTDRNFNPRTCDQDADKVLTINSYVINLKATGGQVVFKSFINGDASVAGDSVETAFGTVIAVEKSNSTEWQRGQGGGVALQPSSTLGTARRLMRITVIGAKGNPDLQIATTTSLSPLKTSFGTACPGLLGDNTYALSQDWFDTDGLGPDPGGDNGSTFPTLTVPVNVNATETDPSVSITATTSDPDNAPMTLTQSRAGAPAAFLTGPTSAGPAVSPTITLSGTPTFTSSGVTTFTWTVSKAGGCVNTATTVLNVSNVNRNPVVTAPATRTVTGGTNLNFTVSATDPDVQNINTFTAASSPATTGSTFTAGAIATTRSGTFNWNPTLAQAGTYTVTFNATSAAPISSGSASTVITVQGVTDNPPVVTAPATASVNENSLLSFTVSANDPDAQAISTFTASGTAITAGAAFAVGAGNTSGTLSWTPTFTQAGKIGRASCRERV